MDLHSGSHFLTMKSKVVPSPLPHPVEERNHDDNAENLAGSPDFYGQRRGFKRTRKERGSSAKARISKIPPCAPGKRSSIYRGVTRHRWTGRYEAHLWDKSTWNVTQKKKGKQVYLGAYDEEAAAARAYDLAALKYWGPTTLINFPVCDYAKDIEEMQKVSREEYLASLRRKSSGFSRGVSKYRGVARHHHNGRWEARIGRVFGNKYLYLGTYSTQEEAAAAYDMAAIEYRGLNAVTNFDLSRYIRWLRPGQMGNANNSNDKLDTHSTTPARKQELHSALHFDNNSIQGTRDLHSQNLPWLDHNSNSYSSQFNPAPNNNSSHNMRSSSDKVNINAHAQQGSASSMHQKSSSPTALSLLLQSKLFRQMLENTSVGRHSSVEFEREALDLDLDTDSCLDLNYNELFPSHIIHHHAEEDDVVRSPSTQLEMTHYSSLRDAMDHLQDYNDASERGCRSNLFQPLHGSTEVIPEDHDQIRSPSTHLEMSHYGSSAREADLHYNDCDQGGYNMFQALHTTGDDAPSMLFDSYTRSPHYTLNLRQLDHDSTEILDQEAAGDHHLWGNALANSSINAAMSSPSIALSRRSNHIYNQHG